MSWVNKGILSLSIIFLTLFGIGHLIFIIDIVLLYFDLIPQYYSIVTLNEMDWSIPLKHIVIIHISYIFVSLIGIFRFNHYTRWNVFFCIIAVILWFSVFLGSSSVCRTFSLFQIRVFFVENIDLFAIAIVLSRQLQLYLRKRRDEKLLGV